MLTFIHISDTHISADPHYHPGWLHPTVGHPNDGVIALQTAIHDLPFTIDFILHTGDVCANPNCDDYLKARDLLGNFGLPMYLLIGNHDSRERMHDTFYGVDTLHVLEDACLLIGEHRLITLNTNGEGDAHAPVLFEPQLGWLEAQLAQDATSPAIIATHHPLIETGVQWIDRRMRAQNGQLFHEALIPYAGQLRGVFHGHIHQPTTTFCDGILYTGSASTWYNLQAYPYLEYDEHDLAMTAGFNLVMIRDQRTFIRRYTL